MTVTNTVTNCINSVDVTPTINAKPIIVVSGTKNLCEGSSVNLSATGAYTYKWMARNGQSVDENAEPLSKLPTYTKNNITEDIQLRVYGTSDLSSVGR